MSRPDFPEANIHLPQDDGKVTSGKQSQDQRALRHSRQLEIIQELGEVIGSEDKAEEAVGQILRWMQTSLGYSAIRIYRVSPVGKDLWLYLESGEIHQAELQGLTIFSVEEDNIVSRVLRQGEIQAEPAAEPRVEAEVALPLRVGKLLLGVMWVQGGAETVFDRDEVRFLRSIAGMLATMIKTRQSLRQLQDELQEIQILYKLQRRESSERQQSPARTKTTGYEYDHQAIRALGDLPPQVRLALTQDQEGVSAIQDTERKELLAPIRLHGQTIGVLGVEDTPDEDRWSNEEIGLLEEISSQVGLAIENSRLLHQAQERTKELSILFETSRRLSETVDLQQIYNILAGEVMNYLRAGSCTVWLLNRSGSHLEATVALARNEAGQVVETAGYLREVLSVCNYSCLQQLIEQPDLFIEHADEVLPLSEETEERTSRLAAARAAGQTNLETLALFPIVARNRLAGLVEVGHYYQRRDYNEDEAQLVQAIVARAMVAVENGQLFQQTEVALAETRKLYQISRSLVESTTMAEIFQVVLDNIRPFNLDRVSISLLERDPGGEIDGVTIMASWDRESDTVLPIGTKLPADTFPLVTAFAQPPFHPLVSEDLSQREGQDARMDEAFRLFMYEGLGAITLFSAPMFLGPEYKGVLSISTRQPHVYTEQEMRIYQTLADQAIIAIERQRLLEATQRERDRASLLYVLGQALSQTTNIDEVKEAVLSFRKELGAAETEIIITDGEDFATMASTIPDRRRPPGKSTAQLLREGFESEALRQGRPVVQEFEDGPVWIHIPFYSQRSSLHGVLTFVRPAGAEFGRDDTAMMDSVAVQTAAALENVWLLEQTAEALRETEMLYKATRDFNSARHVEELLAILVESFLDSAVDYVAIGRVPELNSAGQPQQLHILVRWDRQEGTIINPDQMVTAGDYPFITAFNPTTPYEIHHEQLEEGLRTRVASLIGTERSVLCVPLNVSKNWLGVLLIASQNEEAIFKLNAITQVFTLAGQAAVVMQNLELVEETQQNLYNSEILSHLSQELLVADTRETIYNFCLEAIAATEPGRGAAIFMYEQIEGSVDLELAAIWNNSSQEWVDVPIGSRFSTDELGLVPLLKTGQTVVSTQPLEDERFSDVLRQLLAIMQINSLVAIPVWLNKEVAGFILIGHYLNKAFQAEIVRLYEDISRQTSGALENRRLFEEAQYRAILLETAAEVSQAATGSLELESLLPQTVELIRDRFDYYHVSIFLVDEYRKNAVVVASTGEIGQKMLAMRHMLEVGGKSIVGTTTVTAKPKIALDVGVDAVHFNNPLLPETRSEMALPLIAQGQVIGALDVQSKRRGAFSQSDITILQSMANQLANAIEAARAYQASHQSLQEVKKIHERYLSGQWDDFLKQQQMVAGYRLTSQGVATIAEQEEAGEDILWARLDRARQATRPMLLAAEEAPAGDIQSGPEENTPATLIAPLKLHDGMVIGAVDLDILEADRLDEDSLLILEAVANQAAQAIESARLFQQTQTAQEEAQSLYEVGRALVEAENLEEMYHTVLREMLSTLGLKQGGILFFDEDRKFGSLHALFENNEPVQPGLRFPIEDNPSYEKLIRTKQPVAIEDVITDPLVATVREINLSRGIASLLLIPIIVNDEVVGAMGADAVGHKHIFTDREVNLALAMADQLSLMLQNRRLLEETRRRAVQLQTSADVGRVATSILNQDLMLGQAVELIKERFGFYHAQIFLIDEAEQFAVLYKSTGEAGQKLLTMNHKVAIGSQSVIGQVTDQRRSMVVREAEFVTLGDPAADLSPGKRGVGILHRNEFLPDTRAELAVPLQVGEQLIGVLDVQSTSPEAFTGEDTAVLETLAAQLAVAIQNARAFREQQATAERLKEIDKLKTQFLANMSHELRTPLNSIIGFSRVILKGIDGPLTELQKTDLTSIHNSGQHLLGLINNILDLSKIEAGKMELNFEEIEIEPIIKGVMSTAIALVKDKPVDLVQKVPAGLPTVFVDPTRIRQVILNLVSNACKFTDKGMITVEAWADIENMTISVADSGIGIPEDQIDKVFEEFTQVDASTTRKVGGTGLGLPISRHFVEMHKGKIWVESVAGRGSVFYVTLPLTQKADPTPEIFQFDGKDGNGKLVLAVDDDPGVITLYKRFLEKQNYRVVGLNNSRNVVAKTKECQPTAILLDVLIPEKDGWGVIRELKDDPFTKDIPVIICSIVSDKNRGFSLGAADYLIKPIVEHELVKALKSLENRQKEQVRVLVIDDQADDILLIRRILEAQPNYAIIEARNGREGLELVKTKNPDLIILDLTMPEMDGFRVVEELKANEKARAIPIIIVTAREVSQTEHRVLNGQVEALLRKGIFTESELLEDVSRALQQLYQKETRAV